MSPLDQPPYMALGALWQQQAQEWTRWLAQAGSAGIGMPGLPPGIGMPIPATVPNVDPGALGELNVRYQSAFAALWDATFRMLAQPDTAPIHELVASSTGDRRFAGRAWSEQPYYALLKQGYLLYSAYLKDLAHLADLPADDKRRLAFLTRQYLDAIAPSNFIATNPDALKRAYETEGASLVAGMTNLLNDAHKGRITMSDEQAFAVGHNLAVTPGTVVYRNALIELIQYAPSTPRVHKRPLLIVPPCINKYYILDLRPANSFAAHAVGQGHTVFIISWRNIPAELGHLTWDDYLEDGVLEALRVVQAISGSRSVNTLGFCVGGTMLTCALAVLEARKDHSVASATLLTTMLDFADPGDIGVYISSEALAAREPALWAGQCVHGSELASAFASLRANELVWNYVVHNYLKGETPPAFDLLYWNGDSANLPGPYYAYYLRQLYLANRLIEPGALTMAGERIDLRRITVPLYVYASRDDHIVPWRSAYKTTGLVGGDVLFTLGASGHIAGVVNAPHPVKRNYWTNELLTEAPDDWLDRAESVPGSWWPHWYAWLAPHGGPMQPAPRHSGNREYPPLGPAPGDYVRETAG